MSNLPSDFLSGRSTMVRICARLFPAMAGLAIRYVSDVTSAVGQDVSAMITQW